MQPAVARDARPDDAAELVRLRVLMYEAMGVASAGPWQEACRRHLASYMGSHRLVGAVVDAPGGDGLAAGGMAEIDQRVPGPGMTAGRYAHLLSFSTDPRWRRLGMARAVMHHLLKTLADLGVERAELHATATGEPLYRTFGFVERRGGLEMRLDIRQVPGHTPPAVSAQ